MVSVLLPFTAYTAVQCRDCFLFGVILGVVTIDLEDASLSHGLF